MSSICKYCGVCSRSPCDRYVGRNRFDGCYNLSEEQQLQYLAADGDRASQRILDLMKENERLRNKNK